MKALAPRLVLAALAATLALAAPAAAKDGLSGKKVLRAPLTGSTPGQTDLNVKAGGAPWVIGESRAIAREDGRIRVRFEGLVIPALGTTGPVKTVAAALFCNGTWWATTHAFPIDNATGDAEFEDEVTPPPTSCADPAILIAPNPANQGPPGAYIAATNPEDFVTPAAP
jgi:hypothetical protein